MHVQRLAAATLLFGGLASAALAQDTRTVTESVIPPVCTKLYAQKIGVPAVFSPEEDKATDTVRIQSALDQCKPGQAVELASDMTCDANWRAKDPDNKTVQTCTENLHEFSFVSGSLEMREGVTLLIDKDVTLYASRDPKDFDANPNGAGPLLCGTMSDISRVYITAKDAAKNQGKTMPQPQQGRTCKALITINVKNAAIMGDGTIDGRGGAVVMGHDYTWWQMARAAEPKQLAYYSGRLVTANHADGLVLYGIHLNNAPNCHVCVQNTDGFTAWGVHLQTPTVKGTDARNTDGIDPGSSTNVTVAHSWIDNGDDNIAIKSNVTHMSVLDNHFYDGHGMSIGSEVSGDNNILVDGLTEDHTTSGIRIKSNAVKGGPVHDLTFRNICMRGVQVPIAISPYYNNGTVEGYVDPGIVGDHIPDYKKISLENVYDETPGDVLIAGKDDAHRTQVWLNNVLIQGLTDSQVHLAYVDLSVFGLANNALSYDLLKDTANKTVKLTALGDNVVELKTPSPSTCGGKFVPYQ